MPAFTSPEDIKSVKDVANSVAMHATSRCGPVGHVFPFIGPFATVTCDSRELSASFYSDYTCTNKTAEYLQIQWGGCYQYPFDTKVNKGPRFIKVYNKPIVSQYSTSAAALVAAAGTQSSITDDESTIDSTVLYALSAGIVFLTLVVSCMACGLYQAN